MGRGGMPAMGAMWGLLCICVSALLPLAVVGAPNGAAVESVPGFSGTLPSKHHAGYVSVNDTNGRELFYYFVESEGNPATDPVVLWLNGGPGCSSFDGFIYEHGPFKFEPAADSNSLPKLTLNPYSWSKAANVLYVDSPAGVGFSYSKTRGDYITGDLQTALDTHAFLLKWFEDYPEFQKNPFFITGESYAGIYVPTLSRNVAHGITAGVKPVINFKVYRNFSNSATGPYGVFILISCGLHDVTPSYWHCRAIWWATVVQTTSLMGMRLFLSSMAWV
ncbi:hypothetical protein M758_7G119100 [Ceratodon purpureus]|nr:hypothetical protein M758_7G119100 [Ceratodon purpureus]